MARESVFSLKNVLKRKVLMDIDPRKADRAIRDRFEKCLLCTNPAWREKVVMTHVLVYSTLEEKSIVALLF